MAIGNINSNILLPPEPREGNNVPFKPAEAEASERQLSEVNDINRKQSKQESRQLDVEDIQKQASELNNVAKTIDRRLQFKIDDSTGDTVVSVYDRETEELIRQIPPEELLTLTKRLKQLREDSNSNASGVILQKQV